MSNIIYKQQYAQNYGERLGSSTEIFAFLRHHSMAVIKPPDDYIKTHPLKPKSECPGICVATLKPEYDCRKCYIKAEAFQSTDTLILDIDEVPTEVVDVTDWLRSLLPTDVQFFWYSTPRYTSELKRIRVVIRLSREISPEEKHDLQYRLKIPGVDKASFEIGKFSLLPVWCAETTEFYFDESGSKALNIDLDLPPIIKPSYKLPKSRHVNYIHSSNAYRLSADEIPNLIEEINDAPNGHSRDLMMPRLSSLFRRFDAFEVYTECMNHLDDIERYDRQHDFQGLIEWFYKRNK
jgi:hypothetical protein